ncbi:hypothetical protein [Nonomuraea fuscirosea]|uniref:hypothetical protein n=1 Tax=Nonomuraea fuscirosea TaxID=1291556 RepID=UPI0011B280BA|nr:hypothetical protein [Nonomuraea fuscirosea]
MAQVRADLRGFEDPHLSGFRHPLLGERIAGGRHMTPEQETTRLAPITAVAVADRLQRELATHGITTDVNDGYGLAVVSVSRGLVVWTNGDLFWWCSGWNDRRDRPVYAWHPSADPQRAARRIAARVGDLRSATPKHPQPTPAPPNETPLRKGGPA